MSNEKNAEGGRPKKSAAAKKRGNIIRGKEQRGWGGGRFMHFFALASGRANLEKYFCFVSYFLSRVEKKESVLGEGKF